MWNTCRHLFTQPQFKKKKENCFIFCSYTSCTVTFQGNDWVSLLNQPRLIHHLNLVDSSLFTGSSLTLTLKFDGSSLNSYGVKLNILDEIAFTFSENVTSDLELEIKITEIQTRLRFLADTSELWLWTFQFTLFSSYDQHLCSYGTDAAAAATQAITTAWNFLWNSQAQKIIQALILMSTQLNLCKINITLQNFKGFPIFLFHKHEIVQ